MSKQIERITKKLEVLEKAFSESARLAALEARRAKAKDKPAKEKSPAKEKAPKESKPSGSVSVPSHIADKIGMSTVPDGVAEDSVPSMHIPQGQEGNSLTVEYSPYGGPDDNSEETIEFDGEGNATLVNVLATGPDSMGIFNGMDVGSKMTAPEFKSKFESTWKEYQQQAKNVEE